MPPACADDRTEGLPRALHIAFASGERPHRFWVAGSRAGSVHKILSKSLPDRSLDVVVVEEGPDRRRRTLARVQVPRSFPSGWLERWVEVLAEELSLRFRSYDLRDIETVEEWRIVAARYGWNR
jgi:hypothetical protein